MQLLIAFRVANAQWFLAAIDSADGIIGNLPGSNDVPSIAGVTQLLSGPPIAGATAATVRRTLPKAPSSGTITAEGVVDKLKVRVCAWGRGGGGLIALFSRL